MDGGGAVGGRWFWQIGNYVSIPALSTLDGNFEFVTFCSDNYTSRCCVMMNLVERFVLSRVSNAIHGSRSPTSWLCQSRSRAWLHWK